ncbi:MAG TPA: hypothetical protein DDX25_08100 [Firmicutes bacterium]|jgi:hypothetical protein|nr:hypothetical protein [Bacillota bacterium]
MILSSNRNRRPARVLEIDEELDGDLELSLPELLSRLARDVQLSVLTLSDLGKDKSRIFSPWEQIYLSQEAKGFLMAALHREMVTAHELEQALALLFAEAQGFADLEDIRVLLESVVEDPERQSMLALFDAEYVQ